MRSSPRNYRRRRGSATDLTGRSRCLGSITVNFIVTGVGWAGGSSGQRQRRRSESEAEIIIIFVLVVIAGGGLWGHDLSKPLSSSFGGDILSALNAGHSGNGGGATMVRTRRGGRWIENSGFAAPMARVHRTLGSPRLHYWKQRNVCWNSDEILGETPRFERVALPERFTETDICFVCL